MSAEFMPLRCVAALLCALFVSTQSHAQLAQNIFIGNPKALSLGNAVTADPPGTDAIHFNPAGLTRLKGRQFELKGVAADFSLEATFEPGDELQQAFEMFPDTLQDPMVNGQTSEITGVSVMLPGFGLTELPVLVAGLGNFSVEVPEKNLVWGTGVFAPMMLGIKRDEDDPGVFSSREVGITRLTYFAPSLGLEISDAFSVGGAINFSYVGVGLNFDMRLPNFTFGAFETLTQGGCFDDTGSVISNPLNDILCPNGPDDLASLNPFQSMADIEATLEKNLSVNFNLGFLWDVTPWLTVGAVYMSPSRDRLEGDVRIEYAPEVQGAINNLVNSDIGPIVSVLGVSEISVDETEASVVIEQPQHFAVGLSVQVTPKLKTNIDVKWTDTGVWDVWEIKFKEQVPFLGVLGVISDSVDQGTTGGRIGADGLYLPRYYESVTTWAIGFEYQYNDRLALRLGYEPRGSSVPDDKADLIIPIGDTTLYSTGFSFYWSKDTYIEGALGYIESEQNIPSNGSTNSTSTAIDNFVYNPYAGYNMKTDLSVIVGEISIRSTF